MSDIGSHTHINGRTFKVGYGTYNLTHSYGHWTLRKVINGKPHDKPELTNKRAEAIFRYLGDTERCSYEHARQCYENAATTV